MTDRRMKAAGALSLVLCLTVVFSCVFATFAGAKQRLLTSADLHDREKIVSVFNKAVNDVKTRLPSYNYTMSYGADTTEDPAEESAEESALELLIAGMMGDLDLDSAIIGTIAPGTTAGSGKMSVRVGKGQNVSSIVPVKGKSYISALTADDDFDIQASFVQRTGHYIITFTFPSIGKDEARSDSSLGKVFDLLDEETVVRFNKNSKYAVKLDYFDVNYLTPQVEALIDVNGRLLRYTSVMTYDVNLKKEGMGLIGGIGAIADSLVGILQDYKGKLDLSNFYDSSVGNIAKVLMGEASVCRYTRQISLSGFDWMAKLYGDLDANGDINAADARLALRAAVGIDTISAEFDKLGADVDGDGVVTAADARLILRVAVGLDEAFSPLTNGYVPGSGIIPGIDEPEEFGWDDVPYTGSDYYDESLSDEIGSEEPSGVVTDPTEPTTAERTTLSHGYTVRTGTTEKSGAGKAGEIVSNVIGIADQLLRGRTGS